MRQSIITLAMCTACVTCVGFVAYVRGAGAVDAFEYADELALKNWWPSASWSPDTGISLSTAQNHTPDGSKSVVIDNDFGTIRGIERTLVDEAVIGSAAFWVYDPADDTTDNNGIWVGVINTAASYRSWNLGVASSGDSSYQDHYWYDIAGTKVETTIARTKGWHEFRFEIGTHAAGGAANARLFIDDIAVKTQWYSTGNVAFDTARIMSNPGTKSSSPFYVDDFMTSVKMSQKTPPKFKTFCDPDKWFEFPIPTILPDPQSNSLDFSFLLDAPAGKHGFVQVEDGNFVFEDGTSARFFGLNIHSAQGLRLSHTQADALAERLASLGCNLVRFHSIERPAPQGILDPDANDTVTFDNVQLDMMDYFISVLKQRGIYVKIDVVAQCHRRVKVNDGLTTIEDYDAPDYDGIWPGPWGQCYFDPNAEDLARRFSEKLLNHVNPYTGLRLADEPSIAFVELSNEANVARMGMVWNGICYSTAYQDMIRISWNQWLLAKYGTRNALADAWTDFTGTCALAADEDPALSNVIDGWPKPVTTWRRVNEGEKAIARMSDFALFLEDMIAGYTQRMLQYLKDDIGAKFPILDTNDHGYFRATLRQASKYNDFSDVHAYWSHPPKYYNLPAVKVDPVGLSPNVASLMVPTMGRSNIAGLPLLISEWNTCWPDEWRSADMLLMSAYSCLNDWDAPIAYSYIGGYDYSLSTSPQERIVQPTMFHGDPAEMGLFPLAALAFHRRYISVSENVFEYACSDADTTFSDTMIAWVKLCGERDPMLYLPLIGRTQTKFFDSEYIPSTGVTMTVSCGETASGDYSAASNVVVMSGSPFIDAGAQEVDGLAATKKLWPTITGWHTNSDELSVDWGIDNSGLPTGCSSFYPDEGGRPNALRDSSFAVVPNSDKLSRYQLAEFVMDSAKDWGLLEPGRGYSHDDQSVVSDTGEIRRLFGKGQFIIDTEHMMGFSGFCDDGAAVTYQTGTLNLDSPFATIVLISIDGEPLSSSGQMVLVAQGRSDNSGSLYEKTPRDDQLFLFETNSTIDSVAEWDGHTWPDIYEEGIHMEIRKTISHGDASSTVVVEPVTADYYILRNAGSPPLKATLLDRFGKSKGDIAMEETPSGYVLKIRPEWDTIYCLISEQ